MKPQYDHQRDLLYLLFRSEGSKASRTVTISPGVHADFDSDDQLVGIEMLEASKLVGTEIEFMLPSVRTPGEAM